MKLLTHTKEQVTLSKNDELVFQNGVKRMPCNIVIKVNISRTESSAKQSHVTAHDQVWKITQEICICSHCYAQAGNTRY